MLGNGRCEAMCIDGVQRLCHIRGKLHKTVWIAAGDIILVGLRDYQDKKADVILRYFAYEARLLKAYGELPNSIRINEGIAGELPDSTMINEDNGDYIEFENPETSYVRDKEYMNVFGTFNGKEFDLLLANGIKYADLVEFLTDEIKVDRKTSCLKIVYDVGDNMAPVNITNDNSLMLYMELKKKDPRITAYALHVEVVKMSN
ncbi:eukaryotic translation initiation factor 1A-like isoform X3 [Olea europaea var. sylvestris]|nr:eukaryotic translation initiation factor 1A-like isoform X2 [Olea europaea var. sylvestris]XP_022871232.1 eukaryotic translation initiation factor 1A-like isoform X3 [Olea europaea var. sylvestris]CAA2934964.1 eukaryotic translation initiation factor 1A [Olea europaea subsp. europaea]